MKNPADVQEKPVQTGEGLQQGGGDLAKLPLQELEERLSSSGDGLSGMEAQKRLEQYGYNELPEKRENSLLKFLSYFWGPIPVMIMIAAILSAVLKHWPDLGVILALLFMNAVVGFREEYQAGNAIAALKKQLALQARVKRDGKWEGIPARELVPGDIVRLRIGDIVPADARLLEGEPMQVVQAALTGESLPVEKKTGEAVFSGSIIKQGELDGLVYATGQKTFYGKTVELVQTAETRSHLQKAVVKIADYLLVIAVVLAIIIVGVAFTTQRTVSDCTSISPGANHCGGARGNAGCFVRDNGAGR